MEKVSRNFEKIRVIGLMSGTSLDGLDICYAQFSRHGRIWSYQILQTEEVKYPEELQKNLSIAQSMSALEYARLDSDYGLYLGRCVKAFIAKHGATPDFVASHGHTVFHQPDIRLTSQVGRGAGIAAESGLDCVCDFRTTDVALGGQGAPLVPIGDRLLFGSYDYCLNLGGFSNISFEDNDAETVRIAYDVSPVNYVLNHYMRSLGREYDEGGNTARSGRVDKDLISSLNTLPYYDMPTPKSLGREWVETEVFPLIDSHSLPLEDVLCTFVEHAATQLSRAIKGGKVLTTGGGAHNSYLIERMKALAPQCVFHVPDAETINFKEALLFAFLGVLYMNDEENCLNSVTGAVQNNIGGCLYKAVKQYKS